MRNNKRVKLGNIYEIPLPNGFNAYGRLYEDSTLGIYKEQCKDISQLSLDGDYAFFVAVYLHTMRDGEWKVAGYKPFAEGEDEWPPTRFIKTAIEGHYSLYIKGEIIPATKEECKGLEAAAVWDRNHVVDRLMGDDKWNMICE